MHVVCNATQREKFKFLTLSFPKHIQSTMLSIHYDLHFTTLMIQIFNTYDVSLHRPVLTMSPDPFLPCATNETV